MEAATPAPAKRPGLVNRAQGLRRKQPSLVAADAGSAPSSRSSSRRASPATSSAETSPRKRRDEPADAGLGAGSPHSPSRVVTLVRDAVNAVNAARAAVSHAGSGGLAGGINVNLSHTKIHHLPNEVLDVLSSPAASGGTLERLALSHNSLTTLPPAFSRLGASLRYLNVKNNQLSEFPVALFELSALEFLDLGLNRLKVLPPDITRLKALRVLSVEGNRIEELPQFLADMSALQRLRLKGNPIRVPPEDVWRADKEQKGAALDGLDPEAIERVLTTRVRNWLRNGEERAVYEEDEEHGGEREADSIMDAEKSLMSSRVKSRRATGRFPSKGLGFDLMSLAAPSRLTPMSLSEEETPRPTDAPPLMLDLQSDKYGGRTPTVLRNQVQNLSQPQPPPPNFQASLPGDEDDHKAIRRISRHARGFSHGAVIEYSRKRNEILGPEDSSQRPLYIRQVPALPVTRQSWGRTTTAAKLARSSLILDVAKGILYSILQVHPAIQTLMSLTQEDQRRSSLEMTVYNTNMYFEELEQAIQRYETVLSLPEGPVSSACESVQRAHEALTRAYMQVCTRLMRDAKLLVDRGDPRYLRTFLMLLYHGIMELRVVLGPLAPDAGSGPASQPASPAPTTLPEQRGRVADRPAQTRSPTRSQRTRLHGFTTFSRDPSVSSAAETLFSNPRRSFTSPTSVSARLLSPGPLGRSDTSGTGSEYETSDDEAVRLKATNSPLDKPTCHEPNITVPFRKSSTSSSALHVRFHPSLDSKLSKSEKTPPFHSQAIISLQSTCASVLRLLPPVISHFSTGLNQAQSHQHHLLRQHKRQTPAPSSSADEVNRDEEARAEALLHRWESLLGRAEAVFQLAHGLTRCLSSMPSPPWTQAGALFAAWASLGDCIRSQRDDTTVLFGLEMREGLQRISRAMKETAGMMARMNKVGEQDRDVMVAEKRSVCRQGGIMLDGQVAGLFPSPASDRGGQVLALGDENSRHADGGW